MAKKKVSRKSSSKKKILARPVGIDNSYGVAAVVLGLLSIVFPSEIFAIVLAVIAFTFATLQSRIFYNRWAKYGKILSIVGLIVSVLIIGYEAIYGSVSALT